MEAVKEQPQRKKYKWELGLEKLGLNLVRKVGDRQVLVSDGKFEYLVYRANLNKHAPPSIMTCTDKTGLFLHMYRDRLTDALDFNKFEYVSYEKPTTVTCPVHGDILMRPDSLVQGAGCNQCGVDSTTKKQTYSPEKTLERCRQVHGDKYHYSDLTATSHIKVPITCPDHGVFMQNMSNHLQGKGCPTCAMQEKVGFNRSSFEKYPTYYLYLMKATSPSGETFYKIGISHKPELRARQMGNSSKLNYKFEVLHVHEADGVTCWDIERIMHKEYQDVKYRPSVEFAGSTECFSNIDPQEFTKLVSSVC